MVFTNSATDPDLPANSLTFSLEPGSPSAASINPANGVFSWTTARTDEGSVNSVTVRVADNGVPPKFDTKNFTINVVAPPGIQEITAAEGTVTLMWNAIPGKMYRVQYKTTLEEAMWINLQEVTAAGPTVSYQESPGANQRFYRIDALD